MSPSGTAGSPESARRADEEVREVLDLDLDHALGCGAEDLLEEFFFEGALRNRHPGDGRYTLLRWYRMPIAKKVGGSENRTAGRPKRGVEIAGSARQPNGEWMKQIARNLTDAEDGFLNGVRRLIHDRGGVLEFYRRAA